jgi:hypothetical protein
MRTLMRPFVTAVLVAVLGGPALAAASPASAERPVAAQVAPADAGKKPAPPASDAARYATRETKAQNLGQFKGGAGLNIYIGGTALAIALFVVLLLVLL